MATRKNFNSRIESRKEGASKRAEERAARSATEQLKVLDDRLGSNQGAKKERARLATAS